MDVIAQEYSDGIQFPLIIDTPLQQDPDENTTREICDFISSIFGDGDRQILVASTLNEFDKSLFDNIIDVGMDDEPLFDRSGYDVVKERFAERVWG